MSLVVLAAGETDDAAAALASQLQLPLLSADQAPEQGLYLGYRDGQLVLGRCQHREKPVAVDFASAALSGRKQRGPELLVKAVGGGASRPSLLDATAGLARDSFILASHGYPVTLLERQPVLAAMVADGIARATAAGGELAQTAARMQLVNANARDYLAALEEPDCPDVIYLDPMFESRDKSALVKKDLRLLQDLVGADSDSDELLELALSKARYRVVVKRPRKAPAVNGPKPATQIEGKSSRYDIYSLKALPS